MEQAGVDLSLTNKNKETIFFGFFQDFQVKIPAQLDAYLVNNFNQIKQMKNKQGKDIFATKVSSASSSPQIKVGRKSMDLTTYQAYLFKKHLALTLPGEQSPNSKTKRLPRL